MEGQSSTKFGEIGLLTLSSFKDYCDSLHLLVVIFRTCLQEKENKAVRIHLDFIQMPKIDVFSINFDMYDFYFITFTPMIRFAISNPKILNKSMKHIVTRLLSFWF